MQKNIAVHIVILFMACTLTVHAEVAYFSVSIGADVITVAADVRYAQDTPYVSLSALLRGLGGAARIADDQIQANFTEKTANLSKNDVAVVAPGLSFALIHPVHVQDADVFMARTDVADFFARVWQLRIIPVERPQTPPMLTPIAPDEALFDDPFSLDEEPGALLEAITLPPVEDVEEANDLVEDAPDETAPEPVEDAAEPEEVADVSPPRITGTVVLDPGHGGQDSGADAEGVVIEKDITLETALQMRRILKETTQLAIHITRETDKEAAQATRAQTANSAEADLLVSIHAGYAHTPNAHGVTVFTDQTPSPSDAAMTPEIRRQFAARRAHGERAAAFAYHIAQTLAAENMLGPVTVRTAPLILQRHAELPCILIEFAYVSAPETAAALSEDSYLEIAATTLSNAIVAALEQ